jgi:hypothetical protein
VDGLIYGVIAGVEPEAPEYMGLSYEGFLDVMIERLLSDEQIPLTIWRRCCGSVHRHTMSVETCNKIREIAGVPAERKDGDDRDPALIIRDLDIAVNNWYLRGEISLSDERIIKPSDNCRI